MGAVSGGAHLRPARRLLRRAGLLACAALACGDPTGTEALDVVLRTQRGEVVEFHLARMGTQEQAPFVTLRLTCTGEQHQRDEIVSERFIFGPQNAVRWERHLRASRWVGDGPVTTTDSHIVRIGLFGGQRDEEGRYLMLSLRPEDSFDSFGVELRPRGPALVLPQATGGSCAGDSQQFRFVEKIFVNR